MKWFKEYVGSFLWGNIALILGSSITANICRISNYYGLYFFFTFSIIFGGVIYFRAYNWFLNNFMKMRII